MWDRHRQGSCASLLTDLPVPPDTHNTLSFKGVEMEETDDEPRDPDNPLGRANVVKWATEIRQEGEEEATVPFLSFDPPGAGAGEGEAALPEEMQPEGEVWARAAVRECVDVWVGGHAGVRLDGGGERDGWIVFCVTLPHAPTYMHAPTPPNTYTRHEQAPLKRFREAFPTEAQEPKQKKQVCVGGWV